MLLFPKKYITMIRLGRKTTALRVAGYSHWHVGQRAFVPTVGYVVFDRVERADFVKLTDDDIRRIGCDSREELWTELLNEYSEQDILKRLWRIDFHILPLEEQERIVEDRKRDKMRALQAISRRRGSDTIYGEIQPGEDVEMATPPTTMTEQEVVEAMADRCTVYHSTSSWENEPARSEFFKIFQASPRDSRGVPTLSGEWLRVEVKRLIGDDERWNEIKWILHDVCSAWNQWQYAIKKWKDAGE